MSSDVDQTRETPAGGGTFEGVVIPHLTAAYRLAHRLMQNEHDAEDVVQEASLRAFRYFRTFTGGNSRAWLLRIVRNICVDWRGRRSGTLTDPFDEREHSRNRPTADPEALLIRTDSVSLLADAMSLLPNDFHHVLVLREFADRSYQDIAQIMKIPLGTVMSRLSRARGALRDVLRGDVNRSRVSANTHLRDERCRSRAHVRSGHGPSHEPRSSRELVSGIRGILASSSEPRHSVRIATGHRPAPAAPIESTRMRMTRHGGCVRGVEPCGPERP